MNKERLLILATFLETMVPPEQWDYRYAVGLDWKGAQDLSCGTTGCAMGWAASIPVLRRAGMRLPLDYIRDDGTVSIDMDQLWENVQSVFEITYREAQYLFVPRKSVYNDWAFSGLHSTSTATDVAKHIRRFVKRGGMPGEVVGYAVKMFWGAKDFAWRGKQMARSEPQVNSDKAVKMTLEEANATAAVCVFNESDGQGRKVVKLVRKKK